MDRLEAVAVEDADVVVSGLDHDEEIHRIGVELRPCRQRAGRMVHDARGADLGLAPDRRGRHRRVDRLHERGDVRLAQRAAERRHLHAGPAVADDARGVGLLQALEVLGQQRRAHAAVDAGAVAAGAVRRIQIRGRGRGRDEQCEEREPPHAAISSSAR